ncbi:MAG: PEP-CTERM sorting domain-containing protein, partial [Phycisphaeraceae bacterium]
NADIKMARLFSGDVRGGGSTTKASFDEFRLGTTFESVAPIIPEPATVGLVLLGGAMLFGRRGRGNRDV